MKFALRYSSSYGFEENRVQIHDRFVREADA
jgi:hypothetical protein